MAKQQRPRTTKSSFGKRQGADDDFRKKKREGGRSEGREDRGEKKSFGRKRTEGSGGGERRSFGGPRGAGRSYGRPGGRSEEGGERRERKSYGSRSEGGERRSYGNRSEGGERKSYPKRSEGSGERKSYGNRSDGGERRSYRGSSYQGGARKFSGGRGDSRRDDRRGSDDRKRDDRGGDEKRPFKKSFDKPFKKPFRKDKDEKSERGSFVERKVQKHRERVEEPPTTEKQETTVQTDKDGLIRLNKFISNSGVCSRREADELIKMGVITVNGVTVTEMGHKVKATDDIRHDGKKLTAERPVYILLNKPKGFITTTDDPQERNTVMQLIAGACKERVYPVGRLDRNTTGLLLLTNDGELTDKLTHPSFNAKKIYKVELDKPLTKADFQKIVDGVHLEEGRAMVDDLAIVSDDNLTVGIELHIGWNHVVRRIFNALEYNVVKLDRVVYAGLDKKDLKRGQWRFLKTDEIVRLKHFK